MRPSDLAANLTFWIASPALVWHLARHHGWSWLAAIPSGFMAGALVALLVAAVLGAVLNNRCDK